MHLVVPSLSRKARAPHLVMPRHVRIGGRHLRAPESLATADHFITDIQRFSAGLRVAMALLYTLLMVGNEHALGTLQAAMLLAYNAWVVLILIAEARGREPVSVAWLYWVDVIWATAMLQITNGSHELLVMAMVCPVVITSIHFGARHGAAMAVISAGVMLVDVHALGRGQLAIDMAHVVPAFAVGLVATAAALLTQPLTLHRMGRDLSRTLEEGTDTRRGLDATVRCVLDKLVALGLADHVLLQVQVGQQPDQPRLVWQVSQAQRALPAPTDRNDHLHRLLQPLPHAVTVHSPTRWWGCAGGTRSLHGKRLPSSVHRQCQDIATVLPDARSFAVLPTVADPNGAHGWLVIGFHQAIPPIELIDLLSACGERIDRLLVQAVLVDQLQDEAAAHERVRIGRDLHDTAIQPYLGLKFAVEALAMSVPAGTPLKREVDGLVHLVQTEVQALRETISSMRVGERPGDNALVPALRRQAHRFTTLFGITVEIDATPGLKTNRAVAGEIFHMVNESLNNARKHSHANSVRVRLTGGLDHVRLRVRDNGATMSGQPARDFEPRSVRERVETMGGVLKVTRPDGLNSELDIHLPLA